MMTSERWHTIGDIGQWIGVFMITLATIMMHISHIPIWEIMICLSTLVFTLATKAKYFGKTRKLKIAEDARRAEIKLLREG